MEALGISPLALLAQLVNFLLILFILNRFLVKPIVGIINERRERIEGGLRDADAARQEREHAANERLETIAAARGEASEIIARAQKVADENRERELAALRTEIERLREKAGDDIEAERTRALADVRGQVADLALLAAGRVVGETLTSQRERRLVEEFLTEVDANTPARQGRR